MAKKTTPKKTAKKVVRETKQQSKQIVRTTKAAIKAVSKVLSPSKAAKKTPSKLSRKVPAVNLTAERPIPSVKQLGSLTAWLNFAENNQTEINKLIKSDREYFAANYMGGKTTLFRTIGGLVNKLRSYEATKKYGASGDTVEGQQLINSVSLVKFKGKRSSFFAKKAEAKERKEMEVKEVKSKLVKEFGGVDKKTKKQKTFFDFAKDLKKQNESQKRQLAKLRRENETFKKEVLALLAARPTKKATKKVSKKIETKKVAKKAASKKSVKKGKKK